MAETISVRPADLLIDLRNPRLPIAARGQREAFRAMAEHQNEKLLALAEHIVLYHSLNPAELPIIMRSPDEPGRYVVLEGNRRLTALKALESPDMFSGAVSAGVLDKIRKLSAQYQTAPIEALQCSLMKDVDEAEPWIYIRHNGPTGGAGVVDWGSDEKARFRARTGGPMHIHTKLLDFLEDGGHLTRAERARVPTTTLERIIKSPAVRERIGIQVKDGDLHLKAGEDKVVPALLYIVKDLAEGKTKVQHVYTKEQREDYAKKFPAHLAVTTSGKPVPIPAKPIGGKAGPRIAPAATPKVRDKLIPPQCQLKVKDSRVKGIEIELRGLLLEDFPNAVIVLFRVFVELSVDYYRSNVIKRGQEAVRQKLSDKLMDTLGDMEAKNKLTKWEANPVRAACQKNSFLTPSVVMMHEYIHNRHMTPSPADLRAAWDNLEPFIRAIWPR
ncbi:MAG TPA: hypothetical protein VHU83_14850 [Bryobacteraceae bacterium]|jgi:hypothetical protein|nr:hypothetical protein [Bryobacteraceae bacterium]